MDERMSVSIERLRELLSYNPETGEFRWRVNRGRIKAGDIAGATNNWGHRQIRIDGTKYQAHRLAWLAMKGSWPLRDIDHKDGDPSNNQFCNLRLATQSQNNANSRRRIHNRAGYKGVVFCSDRRKPWRAIVGVNKARLFLGYFETAEEAHSAYVEAATRIYGDFARAA